jgi:hypothetical protein
MSSKKILRVTLLMILGLSSGVVLAEEEDSLEEGDKKPIPEPTVFVSEHRGRFNGQSIDYTVTAGETISVHAKLQHFLRVRLEEGDHPPTAYLTGPQGSGMLSSMAKADALLIVPEGTLEVSPGETLQAIRLDESRHVAEVPY